MVRRTVPGINAGSMADIAFLLLIFFLVTTTMDIDVGISRKLPEQSTEIPPPFHERNVLIVTINKEGEILVENNVRIRIEEIKSTAIEFLDNGGQTDSDGNTCDYCKGKRDKKYSDHPKKAIISIESARGTKYGDYIALQNELVAAYNVLRNRTSKELYGISFKELQKRAKSKNNTMSKTADLKKKIKRVKNRYPMIISEAEPANHSNTDI